MYLYRIKINLIEDETLSVNEFKAALPGSDLDITDIVMQGEDVEAYIKAAEKSAEQEDINKAKAEEDLDYYKRDRKGNKNKANNGSARSRKRRDLPPRPSRRKNNSGSDSKRASKYYKKS